MQMRMVLVKVLIDSHVWVVSWLKLHLTLWTRESQESETWKEGTVRYTFVAKFYEICKTLICIYVYKEITDVKLGEALIYSSHPLQDVQVEDDKNK
jgi:hypothetical protein